MLGDGQAAFRPEYNAHGDGLHAEFRAKVANSEGVTPERLLAAFDLAAACRPLFDRIAQGYDAVLTPAATGTAPEGLQDTGNAAFNANWTVLHVPCVAVPSFITPSGLPVGVQLVGPRLADARLLAVAAVAAEILCPQGNPRPPEG
jgi:Asp-tRNA(Asn)/Glu-tRNA(Gln) amidotransferase A subunit family amidase